MDSLHDIVARAFSEGRESAASYNADRRVGGLAEGLPAATKAFILATGRAPAPGERGGSVCLNSLAGSISESLAGDHAAARSGWLKYIASGVRQPRLERGLTLL